MTLIKRTQIKIKINRKARKDRGESIEYTEKII
jgi:hypothetical protein